MCSKKAFRDGPSLNFLDFFSFFILIFTISTSFLREIPNTVKGKFTYFPFFPRIYTTAYVYKFQAGEGCYENFPPPDVIQLVERFDENISKRR